MTNYPALYASLEDDAHARTVSLCLGMGMLVGGEAPAAAMAVLMAVERAYPNQQGEWNHVRAKFGLEPVAI